MLALGDALAMVLLETRGFNKEDFAKFHPGGMIGRSMLMRVHQVMRPREAMAIVATDTPYATCEGDDQVRAALPCHLRGQPTVGIFTTEIRAPIFKLIQVANDRGSPDDAESSHGAQRKTRGGSSNLWASASTLGRIDDESARGMSIRRICG